MKGSRLKRPFLIAHIGAAVYTWRIVGRSQLLLRYRYFVPTSLLLLQVAWPQSYTLSEDVALMIRTGVNGKDLH